MQNSLLPLWVYQIFPIHNGDTSLYSFLFIWPVYGFHIYLFQKKFPIFTDKTKQYFAAACIALDAVLLEFLINLSSIIVFSRFIFFYLPGDMYHFTTLFVLPFYFLGGLVIVKTMRRFIKEPVFFGILSFLVSFVFVFLR